MPHSFIQVPGPIGNTPLRKVRVGKETLTVKDESANAVTGTHKDRRSLMILRRAIGQRIGTLVLITAGNAGASIARLAKGTGIRVAAAISHHIKMHEYNILQDSGAEVSTLDLTRPWTSEDLCERLQERDGEQMWDVSNGYGQAYEPLMDEILYREPNTECIVAPLGSGELVQGLRDRIERLDIALRVIGVGVRGETSKADKLATAWAPLRSELLQKYPDDMMLLSEEEVEQAIAEKPTHLQMEPSAAVVFHARHLVHDLSRTIFINTGRGPGSMK